MSATKDEKRYGDTAGCYTPQTLVLTREEALALWDKLSHEAYGLDDRAMLVRGVLRRIAATYLETS